MTGKNPETERLDSDFFEDFNQRVKALNHRVDDWTGIKRKRQNLVMFVGAGLALLCVISLTNLTIEGHKLDADTITQLGRLEVQKRLPSTMKALQVKFEEEAPHLVRDGFHRLIDMMPELRIFVVKGLNDRLNRHNADFENKVISLMGERIRVTRAQLDQAYPDLGDREKLEMLVSGVAADFNTNFSSAIEGLYPAYAAEMREVTCGIDDLVNRNDADLTREERLEKEILETMVQLARCSRQDLN